MGCLVYSVVLLFLGFCAGVVGCSILVGLSVLLFGGLVFLLRLFVLLYTVGVCLVVF